MLSSVGLLAAAPVLHEYFELDGSPTVAPRSPPHGEQGSPAQTGQNEALGQGDPAITSAAGAPPAGPHASPDPSRYRLDANTSRPDRVGYDDPFTPSIPPFKRLVAYDSVNRRLELTVADRGLRSLEIGGKPVAGEDQFFGDIELGSDEQVRIPSVGPMARIVAARTVPASAFEVLADSADNWFIHSRGGGGRLLLHLSIDRDVFGSEFRDAPWQDLRPWLPDLPAEVRRAAEPVLEHLELSRSVRPAHAVERLVSYFRSFAPSDDARSATGAALYEEIALGQVGVCRHRSFAFVVTALALGVPSRFVHNEAHAWVEVYDSQLWHRIDLGGAAGDVEFGELDVPHVAPPDPHRWPANSESGEQMVRQASRGAAGATSGDVETGEPSPAVTAAPSSSPTTPSSSEPAPSSAEPFQPPAATTDSALEQRPAPDAPTTSSDDVAAATARIVFALQTTEAVRGSRVTLSGRVSEGDEPCPLRKVRVLLRDATHRVHVLGVLVTDDTGRFAGEVAVSDAIPVGDHDLFLTSPPDGSCGPADSR